MFLSFLRFVGLHAHDFDRVFGAKMAPGRILFRYFGKVGMGAGATF